MGRKREGGGNDLLGEREREGQNTKRRDEAAAATMYQMDDSNNSDISNL